MANALLGHGQLSLAKYLWIVAAEDNPELDVRHVPDFLRHVLERVDWRRDLHFQTCTTIDTLDYSGSGLNEGSKVVIAAAGPALRTLPVGIDIAGSRCPKQLGFGKPRVFLPGILVVEGPPCQAESNGADRVVDRFCAGYNAYRRHQRLSAGGGRRPVANLAARTLDNFLWTTFTRSNPAADMYGIESFLRDKHWGCFGSLVIDARSKPHHAPPLVEDPAVTQAGRCPGGAGGPLHGII